MADFDTDLPEDFEKYLAVQVVVDSAEVFTEDAPDEKLEVFVLGVWALGEGEVDLQSAKKFAFVMDPAGVYQLYNDLTNQLISDEPEEEADA